jgi:hypothetical protein
MFTDATVAERLFNEHAEDPIYFMDQAIPRNIA